MGFFDFLTPLLTSFDIGLHVFLSAFLRLTLWALFSAIIGFYLFRLLVNFKKTDELKLQIKIQQEQLNKHDGSFAELKSLAINTISLSFKRVALMLFPSLVAMIPLLFIMTFISNLYDLTLPKAGQSISYIVHWDDESTENNVHWEDNKNKSKSWQQNTLEWPKINNTIHLLENQNIKVLSLSKQPVMIVHKKLWWNILFANPVGYLPENSRIKLIELKFSKNKYQILGTEIETSWEWIYFTMTVFFSVLLMFFLRSKSHE